MRFTHIAMEMAAGQPGCCVITLNRPERRNALSIEMMTELQAALDEVAADQAGVRAVVLAAAGKVFSSGHDLHELRGQTRADYGRLFAACTALMTRIQSIPQPVIALVEGLATAAGCQLVATCDLAVAAEGLAGFATPGVKIGLFCSTPMVALTRAIGRKRAMEMLLTGRTIDAATAADWGLVNCAVPAGEARATAFGWAAAMAAASAATVAVGKRAFYRQIDQGQSAAYALTCDVMAGNAEFADAQEGIGAFLEKRTPVWTGR